MSAFSSGIDLLIRLRKTHSNEDFRPQPFEASPKMTTFYSRNGLSNVAALLLVHPHKYSMAKKFIQYEGSFFWQNSQSSD